MHWNSSARKVTCPSTILAFGGSTSEFPWSLGCGLGLSHPFAGATYSCHLGGAFCTHILHSSHESLEEKTLSYKGG